VEELYRLSLEATQRDNDLFVLLGRLT